MCEMMLNNLCLNFLLAGFCKYVGAEKHLNVKMKVEKIEFLSRFFVCKIVHIQKYFGYLQKTYYYGHGRDQNLCPDL